MDLTSIDDLFEGKIVTAVPSVAQLHSDKAPGDVDDKGDHCSAQI